MILSSLCLIFSRTIIKLVKSIFLKKTIKKQFPVGFELTTSRALASPQPFILKLCLVHISYAEVSHCLSLPEFEPLPFSLKHHRATDDFQLDGSQASVTFYFKSKKLCSRYFFPPWSFDVRQESKIAFYLYVATTELVSETKNFLFLDEKNFFFGFHFRIGGGRPILCPAFGISFTKLQINSNQLGLRSSSSWSKQTIFGEKRKKDRKAKVKRKAFESRKKKVD